MAFSAGNFSASDLHSEVLAKIDTLVVDTTQKHYIVETAILDELYPNPVFLAQTPEQVAFFSDAKRCADLKLSYLLDGDAVAPVPAGTNDFCDPDGVEIGSDSVTYVKPTGKEKAFKVLTDVCKSQHDFASKVAHGFMSKRAILVRQMEKDAISYVATGADTLTGVTVPTGGVTNALWNIGAVAPGTESERVKDLIHINHFAGDQRMINPVILGGNRFRFEEAEFAATAGGGVADHRSLLTGNTKIIRDTFNLDTIAGDQDLFLVDKTSLGYVNYTWAQTTTPEDSPMRLNHPIQFYMNDPFIKVWDPVSRSVVPYKWDINMVWKCVANNQFAVVYTIIGRGGFLRTPKDHTAKPQIVQVRFADNA